MRWGIQKVQLKVNLLNCLSPEKTDRLCGVGIHYSEKGIVYDPIKSFKQKYVDRCLLLNSNAIHITVQAEGRSGPKFPLGACWLPGVLPPLFGAVIPCIGI